MAIRTGLWSGLSRSERKSICLFLSRGFERWQLSFAKNTECSSGRPPDLLLPRWSPEHASLFEVVALRQLALPEVATHNRVAVLIDAIGEVLARHADDAALPLLQIALVNEI